MRRRHAVSLVLGLFAAGAASAQDPRPASPAAAPRIAVEPASFDFGPALPGKTLSKEFQIRNFGSADLVIESVSTTCGCTAALLPESRTLKPGASAPMRVSLETRAYSGPLERTVLIRSNDPSRGLLEVKLRVTVQPDKAPAAH